MGDPAGASRVADLAIQRLPLTASSELRAELQVTRAWRHVSDAGEPRTKDLVNVGGQGDRRVTDDGGLRTIEQRAHRDGRVADPAFGERQRTHAQTDDARVRRRHAHHHRVREQLPHGARLPTATHQREGGRRRDHRQRRLVGRPVEELRHELRIDPGQTVLAPFQADELVLDASPFDRFQTVAFLMTGNSVLETTDGVASAMKTEDPAGWVRAKVTKNLPDGASVTSFFFGSAPLLPSICTAVRPGSSFGVK